jgi:hypothetical protein
VNLLAIENSRHSTLLGTLIFRSRCAALSIDAVAGKKQVDCLSPP